MSNNFLLKQLASAVVSSQYYYSAYGAAQCEHCMVSLEYDDPHKEGCIVLVAQQILEETTE